MISEEAREGMRRAYYLEQKWLRQIARDEGYSRVATQRSISDASPRTYTMTNNRPAMVLGAYLLRVEELMAPANNTNITNVRASFDWKRLFINVSPH